MVKNNKLYLFFFLVFSVLFSNSLELNNIPVQESGRIKPFDTYARNQLLRIYGKSEYKLPDGTKQSASDWLLTIADNESNFINNPIFYINNPDVVKSFFAQSKKSNRYSYSELSQGIQTYDIYKGSMIEILNIPDELKTSTDKQISDIILNIVHLNQLESTFSIFRPTIGNDSINYFDVLDKDMPNKISYANFIINYELIQASINQSELSKKDKNSLKNKMRSYLGQCEMFFTNSPNMSPNIMNIIIPDVMGKQWDNPYILLKDKVLNNVEIDSNQKDQIIVFDNLLNSKDEKIINQSKNNYFQIVNIEEVSLSRLEKETALNKQQVFFVSLILCLIGFIVILISWMLDSFNLGSLSKIFKFSSFVLISLGFFIHLYGMILRMYVMARPPVTTLYESILFVCLVLLLISIIIELIRKDTLGLFIGSIGGIVLHFIALKYANDGDTMGVLVAVLDNNFWLSTHVTTITIGYGLSLFTGLMSHAYLLYACFRPSDKKRLKIIFSNIYTLTFISLFFTMVGTILGGIWADQSWGRFWGWDPKENGALLIVMWLLMILHMRLSGLIKPMGYALWMSLINIIVALAWFGVNLLSVGLHNYGFTDSIAINLSIFVICELIFCFATYIIARISKPTTSL